MRAEHCPFVALLRAHAKKRNLHRGARVHADILKQGLLEKSSDIAESLVTLYANCGVLGKAQDLLDGLHVRGVFSWTALISAYTQHGQGHDALKCYEHMQHHGVSADAVTFTSILKACGSVGALAKGEQIHDEISKQGLLEFDVMLGTALVDMYAKCGALAKAQQVLDKLPFRDVISWNALIAGYVHQGQAQVSVDCFMRMQHEGLSPNAVTFTCVLKACGSVGKLDMGKEIHDEIVGQGLLKKDIVLGNALVDMYVKCGALSKAQQVLEELPTRDVVSWSALIAGYAQQGQGQNAWNCLEQMQSEGLRPNAVTLTAIVNACGSLGATDEGERIHDEIAKQGFLQNNVALGNALVDMYVKCGSLAKAQQVLDGLPVRNVVSWSALIAGYAKQGLGQDALICFERMQQEGLCPNTVTLTCILKACGSVGAGKKGQQIHDDIARQGLLDNNFALGTALVDMYAKCGELAKAQRVLEELSVEDVVSWSALIAGYAEQGHGKEAMECFKSMQLKGLSPDRITFSSLLNACSHSGLVHEGEIFFESMSTKFGIRPGLEHHTSMVALFGQSGHLDKAVSLIQRIPFSEPDHSAVWLALMGACKNWGDINVGEWAFGHATEVGRSCAAPHGCRANVNTPDDIHKHAVDRKAMKIEVPSCSLKEPLYAL